MTKQQLQVEAIKTGTVIDHIPVQMGIKVLKLFALHQSDQKVTIGLNLPSAAMGLKDILKIEDVFISKVQANKLALYAPKATVNRIENYQVIRKLPLDLPTEITNIFACPNSNCITHTEPVVSHFNIIEKNADVRLKCQYCEKVFSRDVVTER